MQTETTKLVVQKNGRVAVAFRRPDCYGVRIANDLRYDVDYKTRDGWFTFARDFSDALTAVTLAKEYADAFHVRIVARNDHGAVKLPRRCWRGHFQRYGWCD